MAIKDMTKREERELLKAVESDPDTFAIFEHEGKLKVNLVENVKAWGYVQQPDGRWAEPDGPTSASQH